MWFAIRTSPQREIAVEAMLRRKGYDVFLPTETKSRRVGRKGKRVTVTYPLFTRYVFVGGKFSWLYLMTERHVTGVVGIDGMPSQIGNADMARLRAMSGANLPHRHSVNPHRALRTGELAEIQIGPFAGQIVKVEGLSGTKAKIFLNLFGVRKEATISVADLEAA